MNLVIILAAALVPMVMGFIYYNPAVFGKAWMAASGMTDEKVKSGNMPVIFGVSFLLSAMLSLFLTAMVIHQIHIQSLLMMVEGFGEEGSEVMIFITDFMNRYGDLHRSFGHGFIHGIFIGIFFVLPIMGTNALFERKGAKYIAVNVGYWTLTIAIMGGIICQWYDASLPG